MPPSVSITTVLYNSAAHLKDCFSSIEKNVLDGLAELIVVDNASPDNSAEIIKENFPFAKLIVSEKNLGFSGGCNLSWSQVRGRYWLLLNPDTVFPEDGLENLIKWMDEHPKIGAASSDIVNSNDKSERPGRSFPSVLLTLLEFTRLHLLLSTNFRSRLFHGTYWIDGDQLDADWVTGTVMILRREVVEKVGLLSESFFMYGEDMEWCWRIKQADDTSIPPVILAEDFNISPKVSLIRLENAERSVARNAGAKLAKGELLLFVDDDILVAEDFLTRHWQAHKEFPNTLVVGSVSLPPQNQNDPFVQFRQKLENSACPPNAGLIEDKNFCVAQNTSIKKELFDDISGFDEKFTSSEDQDLALRHTAKGRKIVFEPKAFDKIGSFVAAAKQADDRVNLQIFSKADTDLIAGMLDEGGLPQETWKLEAVPYNEMPDRLTYYQAGLFFLTQGISEHGCSPTKIGEYWAVGLPVITTSNVSDTEPTTSVFGNSLCGCQCLVKKS
ncbi:unnamed protein product [Rotaria sp. Silwood1]|nr:unnamed protein product [Rotaria sp. Silwood1]